MNGRSEYRRLDFEDLKNETEHYDRCVNKTPGIDRFCSSSSWAIPAREAFHPNAEPVILRSENGFVSMISEKVDDYGRALLPLEASWCLASPLVGRQQSLLAQHLLECLLGEEISWDLLILAGMTPDSIAKRAILRTFAPHFAVFRGPSTVRCVASLNGGLDAFLERRSAKFRGNLRRALRAAETLDISFQHYDRPMTPQQIDRMFEAMMDIEARSWKGLLQQGVNQGAMRVFYRKILGRTVPRGRARIIIAKKGKKKIGYIMGGVLGRTYRGFQFSFDQEYAHLSLGNLLQFQMIQACCGEGIRRYDLGTDVAYKRHWSEERLETETIIVKQKT